MNSRIHDGGKRLEFGTGSPIPPLRHPYDKYCSRLRNDSFYRKSECYPGRGSDCPDLTFRSSFKSGQDGRRNGREGLEKRSTLICQTFLTENPFFGAYYPAIRPRSAEEMSNKGSERSRSLSTDFDDSKTYKIIYAGSSVCNEDQDSMQGNVSRKTDDIHHFHEHHHFFHDKNDESSNSTYYDKYQYKKAKEQTKSLITDPNKSYLKQPIQESCMIYQVEEDRNQRLDVREPKRQNNQEEQRHLSRSSSKSGKKSSDNETYTVICEHCQKLLRDCPNARIVGYENILKRFSVESYNRRTHVLHGYNFDSVPKTNWKPTSVFIAEPQYQVQAFRRRNDRENAEALEKPHVPLKGTRKNRENTLSKSPSLESIVSDFDSRSVIFKCDECKSIIETKVRTRERLVDTNSNSSSKNGRGFNEKTSKIKNVSKETFPGRSQVKGPVGTKRLNVVSERKSSGYKGLKGSRTLIKKVSSSHTVSGKVSSQKLSNSYMLSERKKISLPRTPRPSRVTDRGRSSGSRDSEEQNGPEKRSSSYSATRDTFFPNEKQDSRYRERRASSEMSKRNGSIRKGLREPSASGKRVSSAFRESRDSNESNQEGSIYKEPSKGKKVSSSNKKSRELARPDKDPSYKRSLTTDKRTRSTCTELGNTCSMNTRSSSYRKESKDSGVKRSEKTESKLKKVETEKARLIQTEDRSMQTTSRKPMSVDKKSDDLKRCSTASKTLSKNTSAKESRRSGTAPGGLLNSRSVEPYMKSSTTRGNATRRPVASRKNPVIQVESTPEKKQSSSMAGIQTKITDLKTQLDRLEALHNMKMEATDSNSNTVHEPTECPKHPIVVCTSTTYIMTKCANDFGDRKSAASTSRESEKIPQKEKDSPQELSGVEEASMSKCKRFCCSEVNPPHRLGVTSPEKTTKTQNCFGTESPPFRSRPSRGNCQFVGARITRAINKVCTCSNRNFLSRFCETPGRTRSCDRGDTCRRLFGNGKNQRRTWLRRGVLTSYCRARERKSCCPMCYTLAVPDLKSFVHRSFSDAVGASERLIACQSYSTVLHDYDLLNKGQDRIFQKDASGSHSSFRNDVEIDETSRQGYFLRTSISDICEYRNGSLIRLIGKSGWVVYTKKLFLEGRDTCKNVPVDKYPKNHDEFAIFPLSTCINCSKSVTNMRISDVSRETNSLIFLNESQLPHESDIHLPFVMKTLRENVAHMKMEKSISSVHLRESVRLKNMGISDFHGIPQTKNNYPDELNLLDCKSAADRNATCTDSGGDGVHCTCRRGRRQSRRGESSGTNARKEKIPVLFEEAKSPRDGGREGRQSSDISVKYVFAEKSMDSERANKVIWSTDGNGSRIKKPCVFGVSKGKKNCRDEEHFSMNDKQRKYRWHRSESQKNKENSCDTNKPQGDWLQNKCVCCRCSPNHACSPACEREELTGIRKLLKDIGITGLRLGFSRKAPDNRSGSLRPQYTGDEQNVSQNASNDEDFKTRERVDVEVTEEVKEEIITDETNGGTFPKKVSLEDRCCDCVKHLEQLLNQIELCKKVPEEPVSYKHESVEEDEDLESRRDSLKSTKKEPSFNPDVLDNVSLQRRRIRECENLLKQFEIQLEDVKRQSEAYACKCEETPRQEEPQRQEESHPTSPSHGKDTSLYAVQKDEVEVKVLAERKCPIMNDDGCIRFEGKILTQLTNKRSTKSVGCDAGNEEHTRQHTPGGPTARKTFMIKNATQMTSDTFLDRKEDRDSEHFIKDIDFDAEEFGSDMKDSSEDYTHTGYTRTPKIEICCERTMCTCEKCCNIHFVDKHYLPGKCFRKFNKNISENKLDTATKVPRLKKEFTTSTSEKGTHFLIKDESTSISDLLKSRKFDGNSMVHKPRKEEVIPGSQRPTNRDEGTWSTFRTKKDEATSTMCKRRKEESTILPQKEIPRAKVENIPVKATPKDEETDWSRSRKESGSTSEKETFINQSDLEKTPSEEDEEGECSLKGLSPMSFVKPKTKEVICECGKTPETEKCENSNKCECVAKETQCAERRKMKKFCDCGSKLKLIEDRLRALEERKKMSDSTVSSPKEKKETSEESSIDVMSEKITEISSDSSIVSKKEREVPPREPSSTGQPKEKQLFAVESNVSQGGESKNETIDSISLTDNSSSLENIASETDADADVKTKVITCHNMNFFDPNAKNKCQCMEDNFCPLKYFHNNQDLNSTKSIFFVTNIDLLRQWSGIYGCGEYSYCKNFWNVNDSALKPVKLPRDWRNVKTAVASFFRSCKLRKKKFTFKRRKNSDGESSTNSVASKSNITSESRDSFIDDCSRSSMPLKRRSFHVLAKGPRPTRPAKERGKTGLDKKRRKRSRKIHS